MKFFVVGCSFRSAPVALRERLAFPSAELPEQLGRLRRECGDVQEVLLLSTCNRVEIWGVSRRPVHAQKDVAAFLSRSRGIPPRELDPALYQELGPEALRHIFRVTASLDAMVVGEAQIGGQVKDAFTAASRACTLGPLLNRGMHRALATAKRVRTETEIARHPVSISSVAADLARRVFGDLHSAVVLVLGAGEMAELAVRHLLADGAADVHVVNRTHERAVSLAFQLGAKAHRFEDLGGQLLQADIVISSTGSPDPILGKRQLAEVMRQRKQRPMFLVDIAVPRDIDRAVGDLPNVYLFDIDDLEQVVAENLKARRREARQAEEIVAGEVERFQQWVRQQDAVPVIKDLRRHFTEVVRAEIERTAHELDLQDPAQLRVLDTLAEAIVKKLLHDPTVELKDHAVGSDGLFLAQAARHLFHLPEGSEQPAAGERSQEAAGGGPGHLKARAASEDS